MQNSSNSDNEDRDKTVEDRAYELTVRKMKAKVYPKQLPKHVSEMSKFVDHYENVQPNMLAGSDSWKFKI